MVLASRFVPAQTDKAKTTWPSYWQVHWEDGTTEVTLLFSGDDSVVARAGERQWTGTITGTFIDLNGPDGHGGQHRWRGWMTTPRGSDSPPFLAGSLTAVDAHGLVSTSGWYAFQRTGQTPELPAPIEAPSDTTIPDLDRATPSPPEPTTTSTPQAFVLSRSTVPSQASFEGRWEALDGAFIITRDGRKLTVQTRDGRLIQGRITGSASCVIGLRPGCCSGAFEDADTIKWQDGSVWRRKPAQ